MTRQLIAFNGKAGSGKDYCSDKLVKEQNFIKFSFADKLREVGYATLGMRPLDSDSYTAFKYEEVYNGQTFRNILENIGESLRHIYPNIWADACINSFKGVKNNICINDLRHANEYFALKEYCKSKDIEFKFIFCNYHSDRYQEHNEHASAQLAQFLENRGYEDLQEVDELDILIYKMSIEDKRK